MKLHVEVAQEDIKEGRVAAACYCPIARAMNRALSVAGLRCYAAVAASRTTLHPGQKPGDGPEAVFGFVPPDRVSYFVRAFDDQKPVTPFSFDLEIPDDLPRLEQPCTATS